MICYQLFFGIIIPYALSYTIVVKPIREMMRTPYRYSKNTKIGNWVFSVIFLVGMLAIFGFVLRLALPYWLDVPSLIFNQYEEKQGMITDIKYQRAIGSPKSWGYDHLDLDGETYVFESLDMDSLRYGDMVTLHYLKHTGYLMMVSDQGGNIIRHTFSPVSFLANFLIYLAITAYFLYKNIRSKKSFKDYSRRKKLVLISFHTTTILILVLSGFTGYIVPLHVVLLFNGMFHLIQGVGGMRYCLNGGKQ